MLWCSSKEYDIWITETLSFYGAPNRARRSPGSMSGNSWGVDFDSITIDKVK